MPVAKNLAMANHQAFGEGAPPTRDPREAGPKPPFEARPQPAPGDTHLMSPAPDHGEETYRGRGLLRDRVALITGADSGIGRAVAIAYAREGADVAFSFIGNAEGPDARETLKWIKQAERTGMAYPTALEDPEQCERLVQEVVRRFGRIDILINNAAYQGPAVERFEDLTPKRVRHTFAVNIEAMFATIRAALPHMRPGGTIINTASIQGVDPSPAILDYAVTKAAIIDLTKGLAQELIGRGIRVNAVAPGPVWTPLIAQSFGEEKIANFGRNNPMTRPAQPVELAPAYVFLASEASRFVVGAVLPVTGGLLF